ncbi:MAG: hypothetical protein E6L03_10470 [Thaumarchaeota archaeon]|nr:MAG: hypothetical protein E6L03_10470 [Nitrososphaerota archaeon]
MRTDTKQWDIRTSPALVAMFPFPKYRIYSLNEAENVSTELCKLYQIAGPSEILYLPRTWKEYGIYQELDHRLAIKHFAHCKTLFHEWLDSMSKGLYDANDNDGGTSSLGWQFAERLWSRIREERLCPTKPLLTT